MNIKSLNRKLNKKFAGRVTARLSDGCIVLTGELDDWNDWFQSLLYMQEKSKYPLQLALRQILIQSETTASMMGNMDGGYAEANKITELIKFASIVVGSVPMLVAYPFVQKYFEKGFTVGAVKG